MKVPALALVLTILFQFLVKSNDVSAGNSYIFKSDSTGTPWYNGLAFDQGMAFTAGGPTNFYYYNGNCCQSGTKHYRNTLLTLGIHIVITL